MHVVCNDILILAHILKYQRISLVVRDRWRFFFFRTALSSYISVSISLIIAWGSRIDVVAISLDVPPFYLMFRSQGAESPIGGRSQWVYKKFDPMANQSGCTKSIRSLQVEVPAQGRRIYSWGSPESSHPVWRLERLSWGTVNEGRDLVMNDLADRDGRIDAKPPGGTEGYRAYTGCTVWQKGIRKTEWCQWIFCHRRPHNDDMWMRTKEVNQTSASRKSEERDSRDIQDSKFWALMRNWGIQPGLIFRPQALEDYPDSVKDEGEAILGQCDSRLLDHLLNRCYTGRSEYDLLIR